MSARVSMLAGAFAASLVGASPAAAQTIAGALQLAIHSDAFTYSDTTNELEVPVTGTSTTYTKATRWGVSSQNGVSLEGGYGLSEQLVVGGLLALGGSTIVQKPDESLATERRQSGRGLFVGPKLDFVFRPQTAIRPYASAVVGFVTGFDRLQTTNSSGATSSAETSLKGVELMARAGIHWFLASGFSFSPALVLDWTTMSGHTTSGERLQDADTKTSGYAISLSLGISGWVGL